MTQYQATDRVGTGASFSGNQYMVADWIRTEFENLGPDWDEAQEVAERVARAIENGNSIDSGDLEFLGMNLEILR